MESIIKSSKTCYYCGSEAGLQRHHAIKGTANRKLAEESGLWIWICPYHHDMIHGKDGHEMDMALKQAAEYAWMKHNNKTVKDWISRFGKSWI